MMKGISKNKQECLTSTLQQSGIYSLQPHISIDISDNTNSSIKAFCDFLQNVLVWFIFNVQDLKN